MYNFSGNFSIRFWGQYVSLFPLVAAIVSLLLTSDKKRSYWTRVIFFFKINIDVFQYAIRNTYPVYLFLLDVPGTKFKMSQGCNKS